MSKSTMEIIGSQAAGQYITGESGWRFLQTGPSSFVAVCPCSRRTSVISAPPGGLVLCPCGKSTHVPDPTAKPVVPVRRRLVKRKTKLNSRRAKARVSLRSRRIVSRPKRLCVGYAPRSPQYRKVKKRKST